MNPTHLLLIPGFLGRQEDFAEVCACLPDDILSQRVSLPEIHQGEAGSRSFDEHVRHWYEQIQAELPQQFVLCGYSLGGRLALSLCRHLLALEPDRILGLIVESSHTGGLTDHERRQRWLHDQQWAARFATETMLDILPDWYRQPVFSGLSQVQIDRLIDQKKSVSATVSAQQMLAFSVARQADYTHFLQGMTLPFYYVSGKRDHKYTCLGQTLGERHHIVADHCGHNVHFEDPQWFATTLTQLINAIKTH